MSLPFGLREFVRPRIPVVSEPNSPYDQALPPPTPPESIDLTWGKPSFLNFNLSLGPQAPIRTPPNVQFTKPQVELIQRHGRGAKEAIDSDGTVLAPENEVHVLDTLNLFYIRDFIETTYDIKTFGPVTSVTPIETHVKLYVRWMDVFKFGESLIDKHVQQTH